MTFNPAKPANDQKIRLGPQDIRDNFTAIETGHTSFTPAMVNLAVQGADPAALAANAIVYSKVGLGADPDLYMEDASGNVIPLTESGKMGSQTTDIYANSISFNAGTVEFGKNSFPTAWGYFNSSGVFQHGENMVTAGAPHPSTGVYNVITTAVLATSSVGVNLTTFRPGSNTPAGINLVTVPSFAASQVSFQLEIKNRNGSHVDLAFYVTIFGGL